MDNPFEYVADPLGIHWGFVAFAAWLTLYLIVRNFIGWVVIGCLGLGLVVSIGGYIIEPSAGSIGDNMTSWVRLLAMVILAAYIPHLLLLVLGLAGDGVRAGDYDGDGH